MGCIFRYSINFDITINNYNLKSLLLAFDDNGSEIIALWDKVIK